MGITVRHFVILRQSLHETLSYYFPDDYTADVQYAFDIIMTVAAEIMTGTIVSSSGIDPCFLKSLEECLNSVVGTNYFFSFLRRRACDEIAEYLKLMRQFEKASDESDRYAVTKAMMHLCIATDGTHALNISFEIRNQTIEAFEKLQIKQQRQFDPYGQTVQVPSDFFETVHVHVRRLIIKNHWSAFVDSIHDFRDFVIPR
eukprot:CAMPEP_0202699614 /NCGR_PEP_ID=MMETSP1385-20130828/12842_1 /ASSEMBLY_ACC=CAM_ASM_000861 /TAXON_ID=933848 /ORGANISM="Elphidium margaritaceum" /LENGTH=200 /DNA_ID=CAMNT_0049356593 /DNA_START=465 /DNA_END=1067 /DNA_ORIENTATION=-